MTSRGRLVSYAQHGEDVVLDRALAADGPGYYVDVGAGSPDRASVTRHFYEQGWRGIHVEPRPDLAAELREARQGDLVVEAAVADQVGEITLFVVDEDGDLSTIDVASADDLTRSGLHLRQVTVPVRTLDSVLEEAGPSRIDFLKVDVEGAEESVLRGVDLARWRPKVVVVEATRPNSLEPRYAPWEHLLLDSGYAFASTDGLNRYYVRADLADQLSPLLVPANPADAYVPAGVLLLEEEIERLREYVGRLEGELTAKQGLIDELEARLAPPAVRVAARGSGSPFPPLRIAVMGTPRTGNTWLRELLSEVFDAEQVAVHHPSEVAWDALPDRVVLQLHWHPTEYLKRLLRSHGVAVVSLARHPLDVLLSVLRFAQREPNTRLWLAGEGGDESALQAAGPNDEAFLAWAEGPRAAALLAVTPEWWRRSGTVQMTYEQLSGSPVESLRQVAALALGLPTTSLEEAACSQRLAQAVGDKTPQHLHQASGGVHVWQAVPGMWERLFLSSSVERIVKAHPAIWGELGYAVPQGGVDDAGEALATWQELY